MRELRQDWDIKRKQAEPAKDRCQQVERQRGVGVDPLGVEATLEVVADARSRGAAVLVSTHLRELAIEACSTVSVLRGGAQVAEMSALDMADAGRLDLSETAAVRNDDLAVFHSPIRQSVAAQGSFTTSYADFISRALTQSDNTANDMVLRRVGGPDAVRRVLARKGFADIRFGPGERPMQSAIAGLEWRQSYALGDTFFEVRKTVPHDVRAAAFDAYVDDPVDGASPVAIASALARLEAGDLLSDTSTTRFLGWLGEVKSGPNRLKGGLPEGWSIAHKTGTGQVLDIVEPGQPADQAGYNDVGILTAPDGSVYTVAVMIGRTHVSIPERMEMMHGVVRAIAGYHQMVSGPGADEKDDNLSKNSSQPVETRAPSASEV